MLDKIVLRGAALVLVLFILLAVFYERPEKIAKKAEYLPDKSFVGNIKQGSRLFSEHCVSCHGVDLNGSTQGPPLVHAYYRPDHHSDLAFYLAVYQGVVQHHWHFGNMPAMKHLTPEDAGHLLSYIRNEQKKAGLF